jgi:hypothetical protein
MTGYSLCLTMWAIVETWDHSDNCNCYLDHSDNCNGYLDYNDNCNLDYNDICDLDYHDNCYKICWLPCSIYRMKPKIGLGAMFYSGHTYSTPNQVKLVARFQQTFKNSLCSIFLYFYLISSGWFCEIISITQCGCVRPFVDSLIVLEVKDPDHRTSINHTFDTNVRTGTVRRHQNGL